ncbi:MAG: metallophosphoesterase [Archangium sp.]|nr:metallophosphoesterase [Archangium sp.]MDP3154841.1 metallophosphoesterase [Archangium sp.]MDP3575023.1 metallophosphoesterase [Archangium sp.]
MLWPRILFGILTLAVFAGANYFVYRRTVADTIQSAVVRRVMAVLLAMLFLAVPVVRFAWRGQMPPPGITTVVLIGWGVFMYTLMALVIVECVKWLVRRRKKPEAVPENPERRLFLSRVAATGALAVGGGIASYGTWRAFTPPEITEVPIKLLGLPRALDGFTIVQLSDIHVGAIIQERFLDQLVATANSAKPDLLAITGDLVDGSPDAVGRYVARLRNLQSRFGTYFVSGNHDYYAGWEEWSRELEGIDFEVLRNRTVTIGDPSASFDLIGVDDWGSRWQPNGYDLEAAVKGRDLERASVLLCHQPNGLELAAAKKVGLQLSGHTHGGQLFPANLIGRGIWGDRNQGLSVHDGTQLYTSRGCGFVGPPMRVAAPPEVVKIILVAG